MSLSKRNILFIVFIALIVLWTFFVNQISFEKVTEVIGGRNGYIVAFVAGFLGGISTFTTVPYTLVIIGLGAAGLSPWGLGLAAGTGLLLGDTTSYLIGYHGRGVMPTGAAKLLDRFSGWLLNAKYSRFVPFFVFLYAAFFHFQTM